MWRHRVMVAHALGAAATELTRPRRIFPEVVERVGDVFAARPIATARRHRCARSARGRRRDWAAPRAHRTPSLRADTGPWARDTDSAPTARRCRGRTALSSRDRRSAIDELVAEPRRAQTVRRCPRDTACVPAAGIRPPPGVTGGRALSVRRMRYASARLCRPFSGAMRAKKPIVNGSRVVTGRESIRSVTFTPSGATRIFDFGNAQVVAHEARVIVADRDEQIDVGDLRAHQFERLGLVRLGQRFEKQVLALQRHHHRRAERALERRGQVDQQRVGNVDDVRRRIALDELDQLLDLLALVARRRRAASTPSTRRAVSDRRRSSRW